MARSKWPEDRSKADDVYELQDWTKHQDNLLATRVSVFLLVQSILIAVVVSLVNTVAGLTHDSPWSLRSEVFGLAVAINLAGLILTLIFWYVFTLNFESIGILMEESHRLMKEVDPDNLRVRVDRERAKKRNSHWYVRVIFRRKGMNWTIVNVLPLGFLFLWFAVGISAFSIFFSG